MPNRRLKVDDKVYHKKVPTSIGIIIGFVKRRHWALSVKIRIIQDNYVAINEINHWHYNNYILVKEKRDKIVIYVVVL